MPHPKRSIVANRASRAATRNSVPADAPCWTFVHANVYQGKTFGNAGAYATPRSIGSLVRESCQNSLDAVTGTDGVQVRYTLYELSPKSQRLRRFLEAVGFADGLRDHIEGAADAAAGKQIGVKLRAGLEELDDKKHQLRLLRIDDFGARGLKGDEFDSGSSFAALVRDNLNSQKTTQLAGGSFGIGSKTLWASSRLLTVLFSSVLAGEENRGVRLIGKSDLSYHNTSAGPVDGFGGAGWFGTRTGKDGTKSTWRKFGDPLLSDLLLDRPKHPKEKMSGTTALILSFHDPEYDDETGSTVVETLASALAENFWPAILRGQLQASVQLISEDETTASRVIEVNPDVYVPSFADAFRRHETNDVQENLVEPGDTVSVPVELVVPATRNDVPFEDAHGELTAECRLVIRLAEPESSDAELVDHIGYTRGRGMITRYLHKRNLAAGARAFHAVVLAGTIVEEGNEALRAAETFLRYAEPPSHDKWEANEDLKVRYAHGAKRRLDDFLAKIIDELRRYVAPVPVESTEGPDVLREMFRFRKPPKPKSTPLSLKNVAVSRKGVVCIITGSVEIETPDATQFRVSASVAKEHGQPTALVWKELASSEAILSDGIFTSKKGKKSIRFRGVAASATPGLDPTRAVLEVSVSPVSKGALE